MRVGAGRIASRGTTQSNGHPPKLPDLGITRDQSSKWQQLAAIPEAELESAVRGSGPKPSTEGLVNAQKLKAQPESGRCRG
jgi:hypothetical protein